MLNIFYGRENLDKEKFIYERIGEKQRRTLVIVPDQYTLEAEKQAFRFLHAQGLMDVEIVSMSRLGFKLLEEQGGNNCTFIDKYGRHMLLAQIAAKCQEQLQVFKGTTKKEAFLEMTNNFISELKQYNVDSTELKEIADGLPENRLLRRKLTDLQFIYAAYEEKIRGKYTDSEDYIDLYMEKISKSGLIKNSRIWIYGFDSFAPKAVDVIGHLIKSAQEVNVVLTFDTNCRDEDLFQLPSMVMNNLIGEAKRYGISHQTQAIDRGYLSAKHNKAIFAVESELFAVGRRRQKDGEGITIVEAANMYNEAESAASYILELLRDKGLRFRDLVVICNDQSVRGSVISRVFEEYGIGLFDDRKRTILNSPMAIFIVSLLEIVIEGFRTTDIFKALKTGFIQLEDEEIEQLENYAVKYRVRGSMWKKPFDKGTLEYGDDGLERIEGIRAKAIELFILFEEKYKQSSTVGQFVEIYYDFLMEHASLDQGIERLISQQEEQGLLDLAEETQQIWSMIVSLLEQIKELIGEDTLDGKTILEMMSSGLSQIEIGVLPPSVDDVLMGTMQRTRCGEVKAVIVIGANEGVLPAGGADEGLFTMEELDLLAQQGKEVCKAEKIRVLEENLAIYRNLSKASDYLWISYSVSDEEGKEIRPSEIIGSLKKIFPTIEVKKDVLNQEETMALIGGNINTLRHLTTALRQAKKGQSIEPLWNPVHQWFAENQEEALEQIEKGLTFSHLQKNLNKKLLRSLYVKEGKTELSLSPSRLERFSRCPFSHFVTYGLRPEEGRLFAVEGREIGDIYHQCLMKISDKLTQEKLWETITEEKCKELATELVQSEAQCYREGVFSLTNAEKYKTKRIQEAFFYVCWALIEQVRSGDITDSRYEVGFGRGREIQPIEIDAGGEHIYIEGKIDRMDVLKGDRVKIIDYKTGNEVFDREEARAGYRLQLMLYLKAAQEKKKKPAGVFYFLIDDPRVDLSNIDKEKISEKISSEMRKSFKLNGIMIDDDQVISGIAGEFDGYSQIVPLRKGKEGIKGTSADFLISEDEFVQLQEEVDVQIQHLCEELVNGKIDIHPMKSKNQTPCTYCEYKGICRFDLSFSGCQYNVVKK